MRRRPPFFLFFIPLVFLLGFAVMLLWNHVLTELLPVHTATYWQATGLLVLCRILFGGRPHPWHRHHAPDPRVRDRHISHLRKHMANMTEEERKQFMERVRKRFGRENMPPQWPPFGPGKEA